MVMAGPAIGMPLAQDQVEYAVVWNEWIKYKRLKSTAKLDMVLSIDCAVWELSS